MADLMSAPHAPCLGEPSAHLQDVPATAHSPDMMLLPMQSRAAPGQEYNLLCLDKAVLLGAMCEVVSALSLLAAFRGYNQTTVILCWTRELLVLGFAWNRNFSFNPYLSEGQRLF